MMAKAPVYLPANEAVAAVQMMAPRHDDEQEVALSAEPPDIADAFQERRFSTRRRRGELGEGDNVLLCLPRRRSTCADGTGGARAREQCQAAVSCRQATPSEQTLAGDHKQALAAQMAVQRARMLCGRREMLVAGLQGGTAAGSPRGLVSAWR